MKKHIKNCASNSCSCSSKHCCDCDGYHTFDELYEHRHLLFLNLIEYHVTAWKSKLHNDGTSLEGWFIAGIELPTGMITYHLPIRLWDIANVHELEKAPKWDGHTSNDVLKRLSKLITRK